MFKALTTTTLAALALGASLATATAQYFPPPPFEGGQYGRPYSERPRYDDRRRYDDEEDAYRPRRRFDEGRPRGAQNGYGQICVTSRGNCSAYGPIGLGCSCDIPGFGPKRGGIH